MVATTSKLNKSSYDLSKLSYLIVLLNMLGKLIENVIGKRLWFHTTINNFVHPHQFMLQLKDLRIGQWEESCIGLIQENLIENSVQDSLSYISWTPGPC